MASPLSTEQFDRLLSGARRVARQAATNQLDVELLLSTARTELRDRQTELARLCVSAREHQLAADRLVADFGDLDCSDLETPASRNAVLVVDDYADGRELLSMVLHNAGFVVRTASNGLEAVLAAYELRPAVIVMDMMLPVLDGIEATRLIKAIDELREASVIAYTANAGVVELTANQKLDHLFSTVLIKPAPPELLVATVQRYAARAASS